MHFAGWPSQGISFNDLSRRASTVANEQALEFPIAPIIQPTCSKYLYYNRIGRNDPILTLCSGYAADMLQYANM